MKDLTRILFVCAMMAGLAVAASAQKGGDKPHPKPPPPVVNPAPPKPKEDRPKKPGAQGTLIWLGTKEGSA